MLSVEDSRNQYRGCHGTAERRRRRRQERRLYGRKGGSEIILPGCLARLHSQRRRPGAGRRTSCGEKISTPQYLRRRTNGVARLLRAAKQTVCTARRVEGAEEPSGFGYPSRKRLLRREGPTSSARPFARCCPMTLPAKVLLCGGQRRDIISVCWESAAWRVKLPPTMARQRKPGRGALGSCAGTGDQTGRSQAHASVAARLVDGAALRPWLVQRWDRDGRSQVYQGGRLGRTVSTRVPSERSCNAAL